jgi:hypothetical protein
MRPQWIPASAGALVTGVMALVLAQMLNPTGGDESVAEQLTIAADNANRWLAMSVLFFFSAAALLFGMPAILSLFQAPRGRGLGVAGVGLFALGCLGVATLGGLMLFFRALAVGQAIQGTEMERVVAVPSFAILVGALVYTFLAGVLVIAVALLRARITSVWVPVALLAFLAVQLVVPVAGPLAALLGLLVLAAGFTGIAVASTAPGRHVAVDESV